KGLEFPITIVSGTTTKPANRRNGVSVVWNDDGTPEARLRKDIGTANHDPRADLEAEIDVFEQLRLLYVPRTRARHHPPLPAHHRRPRFVSATTIAREAGVVAIDEEHDPDDPAGPGGLTDDAEFPVTPRRRGRAGTAIGRAVHATLQFTDLTAPTGLEAQAAR